MEQERVTTKIYRRALYRLKIIAAMTEEHMPEVLDRLIDAEYEKVVGKDDAHETSERLSDGTGPNA